MNFGDCDDIMCKHYGINIINTGNQTIWINKKWHLSMNKLGVAILFLWGGGRSCSVCSVHRNVCIKWNKKKVVSTYIQ